MVGIPGIVDDRRETVIGSPSSGFMCVYFIECIGHELIKIGCTRDLDARLMSLQAGSPFDLRPVGIIENAYAEKERELHERFAAFRVRGEWFQRSDEIRHFIARHTRLPKKYETDSLADLRRKIVDYMDAIMRGLTVAQKKEMAVFIEGLSGGMKVRNPPVENGPVIKSVSHRRSLGPSHVEFKGAGFFD